MDKAYQQNQPNILDLHIATRKRKNWKRAIIGMLFTLPAIAMLVTFKAIPVIEMFIISFQKWMGFSSARTYIGFQNYINLFSDEIYYIAFKNTVIYFIITTIGCNVLGVFLAVLVNGKIKGRAAFRTIIFLPVVMSGTAVAILWRFFLDPTLGPINPLLLALNLDFLVRSWFGDVRTAMIAVSLIGIWQFMGYHMTIYLGGLQTIPDELYECAEIDGAGSYSRFWYITLPLLKGFILVDLMLCIIGGFGIFDFIFVITQGGPAHMTESLMTYMFFQGFHLFDRGYAAAIGVGILVLTAILGVIHNMISRRLEE